MALTTQPQRVKFAYTIGLNATPIMHGIEKASQTYKAGAFLVDDGAGYMTESVTAIIDTAATETKRTLGMALNSATGTTGADVPFVWSCQNVVFEGTLSDLSAGTHTLALTDVWETFLITKGTDNWYLDANAVTDIGGGCVVGLKDPVGTVDGRVYFVLGQTTRGTFNDGSALL
jgi:hypothetical protein